MLPMVGNLLPARAGRLPVASGLKDAVLSVHESKNFSYLYREFGVKHQTHKPCVRMSSHGAGLTCGKNKENV